MVNSKRKGAEGERELSRILQQYGYDTRRGQQYCGANGDADVVGLPYIHVECKRVEKLNIDDALMQAERDSIDGLSPAVFHRKNGKRWKVTMYLDDWMQIFNAFVEVKNGGNKEIVQR